MVLWFFGGFRGGICQNTSKLELAFEHTLKDFFKTEDDSGLRANAFIELVAETVYASGALDQLLEVQKLDKYNIEGAIHAYYDLVDQPCKACQELESSKLSNQFGSMHSLPQDEKNCSVMISFRPIETGLSSPSSHETFGENGSLLRIRQEDHENVPGDAEEERGSINLDSSRTMQPLTVSYNFHLDVEDGKHQRRAGASF
ncbi:unnamed protein product [Arabidopsis thaliana]|uniref:Inositol-pentakisphosphate 2-kinase n=1 Tax=Arabidopsis thaliana TaxID=3702 RepID=A0A654EL38_ARATH|nr:unnamed protein product [Arabidopsis thaliana]